MSVRDYLWLQTTLVPFDSAFMTQTFIIDLAEASKVSRFDSLCSKNPGVFHPSTVLLENLGSLCLYRGYQMTVEMPTPSITSKKKYTSRSLVLSS